MDKARRAAVLAMVRLHKGGWANLTAKKILAAPSLTPRDKGFAAALFYGTAERMVTLDTLLAPLSKKPLAKLDIEVRAILETGIYQLRYMRVPPSAAVNEAVKLARGLGKSSAAGFVNAVLRRAADAQLPTKFASECERVCVEYSVSEQVAKAVMQALPRQYDDFFAASFSVPELCVRVNTLQTTPARLALEMQKTGAKLQETQLENCMYANLPGGVATEPLFAAGWYHVQGEASQYACACLQAQPGDKVLDMCAAPGGKTATLAQQVGGSPAGRGITACELRENRLPLIEETLERLAIKGVQVLQKDATVFSEELVGQNRILCDVPCSGLGVLGKKPDLRYTKGENFEALPALQLKILSMAARYIHKGGRIVYSTCTIRPQENEQVVLQFLQQNKNFKLIVPQTPPSGAVQHQEMVTILPNNKGLDGFFVATLESL